MTFVRAGVVMHALEAVTLIVTLVNAPKSIVTDDPFAGPLIVAPEPVMLHEYDDAPDTGLIEKVTPFVLAHITDGVVPLNDGCEIFPLGANVLAGLFPHWFTATTFKG